MKAWIHTTNQRNYMDFQNLYNWTSEETFIKYGSSIQTICWLKLLNNKEQEFMWIKTLIEKCWESSQTLILLNFYKAIIKSTQRESQHLTVISVISLSPDTRTSIFVARIAFMCHSESFTTVLRWILLTFIYFGYIFNCHINLYYSE